MFFDNSVAAVVARICEGSGNAMARKFLENSAREPREKDRYSAPRTEVRGCEVARQDDSVSSEAMSRARAGSMRPSY
jgi:hypothetical protein